MRIYEIKAYNTFKQPPKINKNRIKKVAVLMLVLMQISSFSKKQPDSLKHLCLRNESIVLALKTSQKKIASFV